jgi:hypothetical protein
LRVHREKMIDLMVLKQKGTEEEYMRKFYRLVYWLRLYEPYVSEKMLVTHFVRGSKDELKATVEIQLLNTM